MASEADVERLRETCEQQMEMLHGLNTEVQRLGAENEDLRERLPSEGRSSVRPATFGRGGIDMNTSSAERQLNNSACTPKCL